MSLLQVQLNTLQLPKLLYDPQSQQVIV